MKLLMCKSLQDEILQGKGHQFCLHCTALRTFFLIDLKKKKKELNTACHTILLFCCPLKIRGHCLDRKKRKCKQLSMTNKLYVGNYNF